ncbi:L-rhamnose-binding lectin ELEL-1-like [Branchiostoma floridae]|uniref:L-rhamnose-binding lectin ELEL-1-like n=2 Tax=Branchiostoma floridae TaxID=7739 RepID=A0A9J7M2X3_BRAFL|nr:L-rhamnose-binding lectin ELEL-1-like [Branchiostoma floridae]XP_035693204.1 L-rhamnose-binding lectin ELEL-1-like [Branchiostoma floridae]
MIQCSREDTVTRLPVHSFLKTQDSKDLNMKTFVVLAFVLAAFFAPSEQLNIVTCEHETMVLNCGGGEEIVVVAANYGRTSSCLCGGSIKTLSCYAGNSLRIVRQDCNGKRACRVTASNDVFGDPCKGTRKYLEVSYYCRRPL